jgi:FkbM family methyltransferase
MLPRRVPLNDKDRVGRNCIPPLRAIVQSCPDDRTTKGQDAMRTNHLFLRRRIADIIRGHPGVGDVALEFMNGDDTDFHAGVFITPHPQHAAGVAAFLACEASGALAGRKRHTLPDGTLVIHQNKGETDFVYQEIFEDRCYFRHGIALRNGDCVFDVGANIGLFSLYLSRLPCALDVLAFEPLPPLFDVLEANRAACHMQPVRTFRYGLAREAGVATFTYYPRNSIMSGRYADAGEDGGVVKAFLARQMADAGVAAGSSATAGALMDGVVRNALVSERYDCELRSLSDVIAEHRIERIDLLKLDVEKSELDVLLGIRDDDWTRIRQAVIEVYDGGDQLQTIVRLLRAQGFRLVIEQDECLRGTPVWMVYALRGEVDESMPHTLGDGAPWRNNPTLLADDVRRHVEAQLPGCGVKMELAVVAALPAVSAAG